MDYQMKSTTVNVTQVPATSEPEIAAVNIGSVHTESPSDDNDILHLGNTLVIPAIG